MTSAKARNSPRRSHEVRALILKAARELFTAHGYDSTTTKEIAAEAGVLESLLFTNFGNKAGLFDAAVVAPLTDLISDYVETWNRRYAESTPDERLSRFIEDFYDLATQNRTLLLTAATQRASATAPGADVLTHIAQTLHEIGKIDAISRDYPDLDFAPGVAAVAGMVFGVALLDDMLFHPTDLGPAAPESQTR